MKNCSREIGLVLCNQTFVLVSGMAELKLSPSNCGFDPYNLGSHWQQRHIHELLVASRFRFSFSKLIRRTMFVDSHESA
jgi:hypothetical protein